MNNSSPILSMSDPFRSSFDKNGVKSIKEENEMLMKVIDIRRIHREKVLKYVSEIELVRKLKMSGMLKYEILKMNDEKLKLSYKKLKSLSNVVINSEVLPLLIYDICSHLNKLHSCGLIHGNLTKNNILINDNTEFMLSEYCLYNIKMKENNEEMINEISLEEIYNKEVSSESDIWQFVNLIYNCLTNRNAFEIDNNNNSIYDKIERMKRGDYRRLNKNEINNINNENSYKIYEEIFDEVFKEKRMNLNEIKQRISPLLSNYNNNKRIIEYPEFDIKLGIINKIENIPSLFSLEGDINNNTNNKIYKEIMKIYSISNDFYYVIYLIKLYLSNKNNNNKMNINNISILNLLYKIDSEYYNNEKSNEILNNIIIGINSLKITKLKNPRNVNIIFSNIHLLSSLLKEIEISEIALSHYIYIICNNIIKNEIDLLKLSFIDCYLRDVDMMYLSENINKMRNLKSLCLCNNNEIILNESMKYLSCQFEYLNEIESFTLQNYEIEKDSLKLLLCNLSSLHNLNYLNLRNDTIDDEIFKYLSLSLLKLTLLSDLYLSENQISEEELYERYLSNYEIKNEELNKISSKYIKRINENYNFSVSSICIINYNSILINE